MNMEHRDWEGAPRDAPFAIRPYKLGDETAIVDLFQQAYGHPMTLDYWRWRWQSMPTEGSQIFLAWSGDTLVGHYAVSPVTLSIDGHDHKTVLSMTTMTHPQFQGKGIFVVLAQSAYRQLVDQGVEMVWGFPNELAHRGLARDLEWEDIHEVPTFRLTLGTSRRFPEPRTTVVEVRFLDPAFDHFWDRARQHYAVLTQRDYRSLVWRYGRNPNNRYVVFAHSDGGELQGYAVVKRYLDGADIVDLISLDDRIGVDIVAAVVQWAIRNELNAVQMWLNPSLPLHHELEKLGFQNDGPVTYFAAHTLRGGGLRHEQVYDYRNWYLTMGDSDVY